MPRKPIMGKKNQRGLLQCERHLLLTGECTPPGGKDWKKDFGCCWVRPFTICNNREELGKLWRRYGEELLVEWKSQGKRGQPWVAKFLARGA